MTYPLLVCLTYNKAVIVVDYTDKTAHETITIGMSKVTTPMEPTVVFGIRGTRHRY